MKTIVITGATGGIGIHTAIGLARTGARVVVTGRHPERGAAAVERIRSESGSETVELVTGDLSTIASTKALAAAISGRVDQIDVLINNAGLLANARTENADGFEADFGVNVVAPYHLTRALLPLLEKADGARVINVTGGTAEGALDISDLQARNGFVALPSYSNTKRALEALSMLEAKAFQPKGVHLHVVYPGRASTAMTRAMTAKSLPWFMRPAFPLFKMMMQGEDGGKSAEKASRSSVYAATTMDLSGKYGLYVDTNSRIKPLHRTVMDPRNQAAVLEAVKNPPGAS